MRRSILLAVAFSIAAVACQPASTEFTEAQKAAIADSVTQLSAEMQRAFDNKDPSHFDYFADWSASSMAGRRSFEAGQSFVQEEIWANNSQTVELGEVRTLVLSHDAVVVERAQVNTVTDNDGETTVFDALLYQLWVREDVGWKALLNEFRNLGAREPS